MRQRQRRFGASCRGTCTIQLKEPLEEQADFIRSPFEMLDRWLKAEAASARAP